MRVSHRLGSVALVLLVGQACMPSVMHGPRVERGITGGLVASYTAGPRYANGDSGPQPFAYGPVGVNFGYGWSSDRVEGLGLRLGAHVPVPMIAAIQPDVYVQLPKRPLFGLDAGVGVMAHEIPLSVMPYAQLGVLSASGSGVYATYGAFRERNDPDRNHVVLRREARVAGVALQWADGRTTTRIFSTVQFGRTLFTCSVSNRDVCRTEERWALATGMALEFRHRRNSR